MKQWRSSWSLHHSTRPGAPAPNEEDLKAGEAGLNRVWAYGPDLVLAMPAAPAQPCVRGLCPLYSDGSQYPSNYVAKLMNKRGLNVSSHNSLGPPAPPDFPDTGNTAVILGSSWELLDSTSTNYPTADQSPEGQRYGNFRIRHKTAGMVVILILGTVQQNDGHFVAQHIAQLNDLLDAAKAQASADEPVFIGADLNFDLNEQATRFSDVERRMLDETTPLSYDDPCTDVVNSDGTQFSLYHADVTVTHDPQLVNLLFEQNSGARYVQPQRFFIDPAQPPPPNPAAGSIHLPGIKHAMVGTFFKVSHPDTPASCRGRTTSECTPPTCQWCYCSVDDEKGKCASAANPCPCGR